MLTLGGRFRAMNEQNKCFFFVSYSFVDESLYVPLGDIYFNILFMFTRLSVSCQFKDVFISFFRQE